MSSVYIIDTECVTTLDSTTCWAISSTVVPSYADMKKFTVHAVSLALFVCFFGLIWTAKIISGFPAYAFGPMIFLTLPLAILIPIVGKLLKSANPKLLETVFWSIFALTIIFVLLMHKYGERTAYLTDAVPEELMKFVCSMLPLWLGWIPDSYTLVFSGFISGFSFGIIENVMYVLGAIMNGTEFFTGMLRFLLCPLVHAAWAVFAAICVSYIRAHNKGTLKWTEVVVYPISLILPIILHGTYNLTLSHYAECKEQNPSSSDGYTRLFQCAQYSQGAMLIDVVSLALPFLMMIPMRKQRDVATSAIVTV